MATESKLKSPSKLTQARVDQIVREEGDAEFSDAQVPGLYLRQSKKGASWRIATMHARKRNQFKFGSPPLIGLAVARKIATAGIGRIRMGYELDARWLDEQLVANGIQAAPAPIASVARVRSATWLYEEAVEAFILSLKGVLKDATVTSYRQILSNPALKKKLWGRPMVDIDRRFVAQIVAKLGEERKFSQAEMIVTVIRLLWDFAASDTKAGWSGVTENVMLGLKRPRRPKDQKKGQSVVVPELETIGTAVAASRSDVFHPTAAAALEFLILTLQRRETVAGAHVSDIRLDEPQPYWDIDAARIKGGARHPIPLEGRALEIAREAVRKATAAGSKYLFPAARPGRRKDNKEPGHVGVSSLTHDLKDVAGMSPHRARHAFATHLIERRLIKLEDAALILDHREGRKGSTALHYDLAKDLAEKIEILRKWYVVIEGPIEAGVESFDPVEGKKRLQAARRDRQKSPKKSEGKRNRDDMAAHLTAWRAGKEAKRQNSVLMVRILEDHRTGHLSDDAAMHALRLDDMASLVAMRLLIGHDLAERPDLAWAVEEAQKTHMPAIKKEIGDLIAKGAL